jgi:hypothetical protein
LKKNINNHKNEDSLGYKPQKISLWAHT